MACYVYFKANRTINSLEVIQDSISSTDSDVNALIDKLKIKRDDAIALRNQFSEAANEFAAQATELVDEIRTVGIVLV